MHVRIKNHDPLIHKLFMQTLLVMIIAELSSSVATMLDGIIISRFFSKKENGIRRPFVENCIRWLRREINSLYL